MNLRGVIFILASTGIVIGGIIEGMIFLNNRKQILIQEIGELRDKLYVLSRDNEEARMKLEESKSRKHNNKRQLETEIQFLNNAIENVLESKRKYSLMELEIVREQLNILALNSKFAKSELQKSFVNRITTEKTAVKEINRLKKIIHIVNQSNKKELMDKIIVLREELQIMESEKAVEILNESYNKKDMTERDMNQEIIRLRDSIQMIKVEQNKKYMQQLKEVRDKFYELSLDCETAKQELNDSYQRKLITVEDIKKEIDNLNIAYVDCVEISRREKLNKLNDIRNDVYEQSKDSEYGRSKFEDSFNKIFDMSIVNKEIEKLEDVIDKIYRDTELKKYKKKNDLYL